MTMETLIRLPDGFDVGQLFSELFSFATPFVSVSLLIASGMLLIKLLKKAP